MSDQMREALTAAYDKHEAELPEAPVETTNTETVAPEAPGSWSSKTTPECFTPSAAGIPKSNCLTV